MTEDQRKIPTPFQATLVVVASFFFSIILVELIRILFLPSEPDLSENAFELKVMLVVGELSLIVIPYLYLKKKDYPIRKIFRWDGIDKDVLFIIIAVGLTLSILGDELDRLVSIILTPPEALKEIEVLLKVSSAADLILLIVGTIIFTPFVEETIFRGLLQVSLENYQNVTRAVIYTSLAWTLIHGILYWAVQIFLMGIILGYLAWRTKSIIPSAICHAINNGLALLFNNIEGSSFFSVYEWKGHVNPLILIVSLFILVKGIQILDRYYLRESSSFEKSGSE